MKCTRRDAFRIWHSTLFFELQALLCGSPVGRKPTKAGFAARGFGAGCRGTDLVGFLLFSDPQSRVLNLDKGLGAPNTNRTILAHDSQAVIVRVMKSRRKLEHNQLVAPPAECSSPSNLVRSAHRRAFLPNLLKDPLVL